MLYLYCKFRYFCYAIFSRFELKEVCLYGEILVHILVSSICSIVIYNFHSYQICMHLRKHENLYCTKMSSLTVSSVSTCESLRSNDCKR